MIPSPPRIRTTPDDGGWWAAMVAGRGGVHPLFFNREVCII